MAVHGIKETLRQGARGRSVSVSWINGGVESPRPSSMRERGSMRRKISNGLNGLWGYDGSDSSGAGGGGGSEDSNNGSSQQLVSTSPTTSKKRIGSMGSLATTITARERSLAAGSHGRSHGRSNGDRLDTMAYEVPPLNLLESLDLTLRNLGVGLGDGLGGVGFGGVSAAATATATAGGGRSSRRASMQYQSW